MELPKELHDLIGEFNVEHRPKMRIVVNELLQKHDESVRYNSLCGNCDNDAEDHYTKYILWRKYSFCGDMCQFEGERCIRKQYLRCKKN